MEEEGFVDFLPSGEATMYEDQIAVISNARSTIVEMGTIPMETAITLEARLPGVLTDHYPDAGYDQPLTPFEMRVTLEQLEAPARYALAGFIGVMVALIIKLIMHGLSKTDGNTRHPALKGALERQQTLFNDFTARVVRADIGNVKFSSLKDEVRTKLSDVQTALASIIAIPFTIETVWVLMKQPESTLRAQVEDLSKYKYSITKHIFNNFMANSNFIPELVKIKDIIIASKEALPELIASHSALAGWAAGLSAGHNEADAALPTDIGKSLITALGVHGKDKTHIGEAVAAFTTYCKEGFSPHLKEGEAVPHTVYSPVFIPDHAAKSDEITSEIVTEVKAVLDVLAKHKDDISNGWLKLQTSLTNEMATQGQTPAYIEHIKAALALIKDVLSATGTMVRDLGAINSAVEAHRGARTEVIAGQSKVFKAMSATLVAYAASTTPEVPK